MPAQLGVGQLRLLQAAPPPLTASGGIATNSRRPAGSAWLERSVSINGAWDSSTPCALDPALPPRLARIDMSHEASYADLPGTSTHSVPQRALSVRAGLLGLGGALRPEGDNRHQIRIVGETAPGNRVGAYPPHNWPDAPMAGDRALRRTCDLSTRSSPSFSAATSAYPIPIDSHDM